MDCLIVGRVLRAGGLVIWFCRRFGEDYINLFKLKIYLITIFWFANAIPGRTGF